tara:strand:- start:1455 stop:2291 length:837 start_codon:yes stop_codon:yes gene_type:complete
MSVNTQTVGLKRNTIDKYYTHPSVVTKCVQQIKQHISIQENDLIIEPSAGNGSFINDLQGISSNCLFYDLEPEHPSIIQQDYLLLDTASISNTHSNIHVVGNPPFGRQSSLAIKFIKKSAQYCHSISFILPKSFKKDSMQKHFPLDFHLVFEQDIEENGFLVDDNVYDVPCVFQIWEKKEVKREKEEKLIPKGFQFVKKSENPDIAFRRVGVYAGNVYTDIYTKSEQSHYFIKFDKKISESMIEQLNAIVFSSRDNTVGPRSISKQELMKHYNTINFE